MSLQNPLVDLLLNPDIARQLSLDEWTRVVALGRQLGLLGRLHYLFISNELTHACPDNVLMHTKSAWTEAEKQRESLIWESQRLHAQVSDSLEFVVLKGGAYALAGLPNSFGRTVSDIDLLVPVSQLDQAEVLLFINGWVLSKQDSYDDYYYRQWMHELPPFLNQETGMTLDLHHNIRPIVARDKVDPTPILFSKDVKQGVNIPCLEDLFIHSATHLFSEGEFTRVLRDLLDLVELLKTLNEKDPLLKNLQQRADNFNLRRDVAMALFFCTSIANVELATEIHHFIERFRPKGLRWWGLKWAYNRMFFRPTISNQTLPDKTAGVVLFLRSHLIKMPLYLLIPHLLWKCYKMAINNNSTTETKII